jgi:hypothetical protein
MLHRAIGWTLLVVVAILRPGVDRFDRWLVSSCWNVPSQWNAVAEAAIRTGVVDAELGGTRAPWRQASVHAVRDSRIAVIVLSDLRRARVTFVDEEYRDLGGFERVAAEPTLVTDEARGYKPLSHVWPIVAQGGRLHTLIAFAHLVSEEPNAGLFAYVAVGPERNELLFVSQLSWGPGPTWGVLSFGDLNGDGFEDFAFYPKGRKDLPPIASFVWNPAAATYDATVDPAARPLISWWSTSPHDQVIVPRGELLDDAVRKVASRLSAN